MIPLSWYMTLAIILFCIDSSNKNNSNRRFGVILWWRGFGCGFLIF